MAGGTVEFAHGIVVGHIGDLLVSESFLRLQAAVLMQLQTSERTAMSGPLLRLESAVLVIFTLVAVYFKFFVPKNSFCPVTDVTSPMDLSSPDA